jgi:hypothetical protein
LLDRLTHHVHILEMNGHQQEGTAAIGSGAKPNPKPQGEGDPATKI